jgi:hypothetical protein
MQSWLGEKQTGITNMFEWLSKFDKIFVTGPQRSGTRICAKMIAHDTRYEFIDETQINMDGFYNFSSLLETNKKYVLQCPTLCRHIHFFSSEDNAIVLMRRNVKDIVKSQKRIKWSKEWLELIRYDHKAGIISEIKYDFWKKNQRKKTKNAFEVQYESLKKHPLWIEKKERENFSPMQIGKIYPAKTIPKNAFLQKDPEAELFMNSNQTEGILVKKSSTFHLINKTSLLIWELCDGTHLKKDILNHLELLFPEIKSETVAKDIDRFVEELHKNHFITCSF